MNNIKIMLACSAGISTGLLVKKMEESAKEKGLNITIWTIPESQIAENVQKCDILLLGPQVRYLLKKARIVAEPYGVPVDVVDMMCYGKCDGATVLMSALSLLK